MLLGFRWVAKKENQMRHQIDSIHGHRENTGIRDLVDMTHMYSTYNPSCGPSVPKYGCTLVGCTLQSKL